jgi:hypothetical protein
VKINIPVLLTYHVYVPFLYFLVSIHVMFRFVVGEVDSKGNYGILKEEFKTYLSLCTILFEIHSM